MDLQERSAMALDWNDLKVLLAVIEHGSTRRAAAALGVEQTTCARRIAALEQQLGLKLFHREAAGYQATANAMALRDLAANAAAKVADFERMARAEARRSGGPVRITCEEFFARTVVAPAVQHFSQKMPDVVVEIDISREYRDLCGGEADLAIRPGREPQEPGLIRRKLGDDFWDVYCSHEYARQFGTPAGVADLRDHGLVCFEPLLEGTRAAGFGSNVRQVTNTVGGALAMIESGTGIGALPRIMALESSKLLRCFTIPEAVFGVWLLYPERVHDSPAVRALTPLIADRFKQYFHAGTASARQMMQVLPHED